MAKIIKVGKMAAIKAINKSIDIPRGVILY